MGSSGAGKTSLLDVIAGNLLGGQISGRIIVNGEDFGGKKIKEISGFVFQDDVLLPTMTVREAIEMSALLRLPGNNKKNKRSTGVSLKEKQQRVTDIIALLNLQGCQQTLIGDPSKKGISGGERKRTSIAMELIANPPMLFLDEPTSGLDTHTAYTVVRSLQRLAHRLGRTVIATIHQPSSEIFALFDDLLILAAGGIVYYGAASQAVEYFSRQGFPCPPFTNPADYLFMQVLRQFEIEGADDVLLINTNETADERIARLKTAWKESPEYRAMLSLMDSQPTEEGVASGTLRRKAPFPTQFRFLLKRASKNALRNPLIVTVKVFEVLFIGLLVGLTYLDSNQYDVPVQIRNKSGALYFLALNAFFSGAFGVLTVFYVEKQVFFREYKARYYSTTAYFFSKFLVEVLINQTLLMDDSYPTTSSCHTLPSS